MITVSSCEISDALCLFFFLHLRTSDSAVSDVGATFLLGLLARFLVKTLTSMHLKSSYLCTNVWVLSHFKRP